MTKHTPGPWRVEPYHEGRENFLISEDDGHTILELPDYFSKADARLIAAAPDTTKALEDLINAISTETTPEVFAALQPEIDAGLAAIAKAEGRDT
jgi:hypothetical protein